MKIEEENWKNIKGYEGLYQISDKGRVKSLKYGKERIMKLGRNTDGYLLVALWKNGERKMCKVHRLVAIAFIPNPNCLPELNHKDENKENNNLENLEWCDRTYNNTYGTRIQRVAEKKSKPVLQFTKTGEFIKEWKSATNAGDELGIHQTHISSCCKGKYKSCGGFRWFYKEEKIEF